MLLAIMITLLLISMLFLAKRSIKISDAESDCGDCNQCQQGGSCPHSAKRGQSNEK